MANNILREMLIKIGLKGEKSAKAGLLGLKSVLRGLVKDVRVFTSNLAALGVSRAFGTLNIAARRLSISTRDLFIESSKLAAVQEDSENRLRSAMQIAGDFSQKELEGFKKIASGLQEVSTTGDEAILVGMALAKSLGATNEQVGPLAEAALNLASATNQTFDTSMEQVSKTLGGVAGRLGLLFPALKELTEEELKAGKAAQVLNKELGGIAQKNIRSFASQFQRLKNTIGDAFEEVGKPLNSVLLPFIKQLKVDIESLAPTFRLLGLRLGGAINILLRLLKLLGGKDFLRKLTNNIGLAFEDLALMFEDIIRFFTGRDSLISQKFGKDLAGAFGSFFSIFLQEAIKKTIKGAIPFLISAWKEVVFPRKGLEQMKELRKTLDEKDPDWIKVFKQAVNTFLEFDITRFLPLPRFDVGPTSSNKTINNNTINQNNNINTPQTSNAINNELQQAYSQFQLRANIA